MKAYCLSESERKVYRRYAEIALPRHTSYPIASVWTNAYGPWQFQEDLSRAARECRPLSLYVHIPFCERLCYFCACTREIVPLTRRQENDPSQSLLEGIRTEAGRLADLVEKGEVHQVHLGGGSPTFLSPGQLRSLWDILSRHFSIANHAEIAVEVDPRVTTFEHLQTLHDLGFNRVSLGIQDFDPLVQRAVNRLQPYEQVDRTVGWCRALGYASINFDLIYGLPFQTPRSMADTLEKTVRLAPDRIAFYRLAVIPEIFRWQKTFSPQDLPTGDLSLELNLMGINGFLEAGYEFIGLDHFAKPGEALARACQKGTLRRNFQGMTTGKDLDVLGLGPSAISQLDDALAQNYKGRVDWLSALTGGLATERGLRLSEDDRLRRELMQQLYGYGRIDKRGLESRFAIVFDNYFARERQQLRELIDEGLVQEDDDTIRLTVPLGRLLVRVAAALFDSYLPPQAFREGLSASQASKVG
jgi:oxygen-independent coproporphyrinogen-3 oxidase